MSNPKTIEERTLPIIFIHAEVDDAGLDPYEFRVYAHLSRRAGNKNKAWPSQGSIAEFCQCSTRQVFRALSGLKKRGMILVESTLGEPSVYRLTDRDKWMVRPRTVSPTGVCHTVLPTSDCQSDKVTTTEVTTFEVPEYPIIPLLENPSKPKVERAQKDFIAPTWLDVRRYCHEAKLYRVDPDKFVRYYAALGWRDKNEKPVKCWKGKCRTWHAQAALRGEPPIWFNGIPPKPIDPTPDYTELEAGYWTTGKQYYAQFIADKESRQDHWDWLQLPNPFAT